MLISEEGWKAVKQGARMAMSDHGRSRGLNFSDQLTNDEIGDLMVRMIRDLPKLTLEWEFLIVMIKCLR